MQQFWYNISVNFQSFISNDSFNTTNNMQDKSEEIKYKCACCMLYQKIKNLVLLIFRAMQIMLKITSELFSCFFKTYFLNIFLNALSANPTKWSNTLKQFAGNLTTNCLSVFDEFAGLARNGLIFVCTISKRYCTNLQ